jgi:hypothetical protein
MIEPAKGATQALDSADGFTEVFLEKMYICGVSHINELEN